MAWRESMILDECIEKFILQNNFIDNPYIEDVISLVLKVNSEANMALILLFICAVAAIFMWNIFKC